MQPAAKPRVVFLLSQMLGWQTYAHHLQTALTRRDDFTGIVHTYRYPPWLLRLCKRNNVSKWGRWLHRIDPIVASRWHLRAWWRQLLARGSIQAAFASAHTLGGVFAETGQHVPYFAALDHTRACMERDLPKGAWDGADLAREAALLRGATHLFPTSQWTALSAQADCGCQSDRMTVVDYPVDPLVCKPRTARTWEVPRLLFVGNDLRRKGADRLLNWLDGPLKGRCELHLVSHQMSPSVSPGLVVYGGVSNQRLVSEIMPMMDVMCLPTRSDMSAVVVVEASMCAIPSVASRVGGIPELIEHGRTGYLVDRDDDAQFVEILLRVLTDTQLSWELGQAARQLALQRFSSVTNFEKLFNTILSHL